EPASRQTSASRKRSTWWRTSATTAGDGRSRIRIRVRRTSRWKAPRASRAAGIRSARSACCGGPMPTAPQPGAYNRLATMSIEEIFLTEAADKLGENLSRIETCVPKLPADAVWARASENENAVGNLLLPLEGNVRQWILSGVGIAAEHRDRPSEFAARSGPSAAVLVANL